MSIARGLIGWWRMDGNLNDASGAGNHGVWQTGSPAYSAGKYGQAGQFDRTGGTFTSNPCVETVPSNSLQVPFTFAAWVRPDAISQSSSGAYRIFSRGEDASSRGFLAIDNSAFAVSTSGGGTIEATTSFGLGVGVWAHLACVWRDGGADLYVNGNFAVSGSGSLVGANAIPAVIGAQTASYSRGFDGQIDNAMIFNRALSPSEIKRLYAKGTPL